MVFGFSLYAAQIINEFNQTREREKRVLLAAKLENDQDLVAEYLFDNVERRLQNDEALQQFLANGLQAVTVNPIVLEDESRRLVRMYFSGYLGKYDVQFKYFNANEIPINNVGDPSWNLDYIKHNIDRNGRATNTDKLFLMDNPSGKIRYMGLITLMNANDEGGFLAIDLTARFVQDETGLPELLNRSAG